jgi:hypothetical protein
MEAGMAASDNEIKNQSAVIAYVPADKKTDSHISTDASSFDSNPPSTNSLHNTDPFVAFSEDEEAEDSGPSEKSGSPKIDNSALIHSSFLRRPTLSHSEILDSLSILAIDPSENSKPILPPSTRKNEDMAELSLDDAPSSPSPSTPPSNPPSKLPHPKKVLNTVKKAFHNRFTPRRIKKINFQTTDNTMAIPPIKESVENISPNYAAQNDVSASVYTREELLNSGIDPENIPCNDEKPKSISMNSSNSTGKEKETVVKKRLFPPDKKEPHTIISKSGILYEEMRKHLWIKVRSTNGEDDAIKADIQRIADSHKIDALRFPTAYRDEKNREITIKEEKEKITFTATEVGEDKVKTTTTFARNEMGTTDVTISGKCRHTITQTVSTAKELYGINHNPIFSFGLDLEKEEQRPQIEALYFQALLKENIIPIFEKYKQEKELGDALWKTYKDLCTIKTGIKMQDQYLNSILYNENELLKEKFKTAVSSQIAEEKIHTDQKFDMQAKMYEEEITITKAFIQSYAMKKEITFTDKFTAWLPSSATEGKKAAKKEALPNKSIADSRQRSFFPFSGPKSSVPTTPSSTSKSSSSQVIYPSAPKSNAGTLSKPTSVMLSTTVDTSRSQLTKETESQSMTGLKK